MKISPLRSTAIGLSLSAAATGLLAQTPTLPTAAQTDPVAMGWMVGSPPPADKVIRFADGSGYKFPQTRWSFSNFRQLVPTTQVTGSDVTVVVAASAL